ncbi:hypothetical protein B9Z19DRAFT_1129504 [Tuber borchii]|uniref:Uncharacterized protein n=1 Tax=Tuber borchii TaxID=42251 RepID=A0A2T6ZM75_TUBBO|nr:hypothetical protein B9Z19DRAFT_1129504 [Tuber borchii]
MKIYWGKNQLASWEPIEVPFISTYRDPLTTLAATCISCATVVWYGNKRTAGMDVIKAELVGTKDSIIGIKVGSWDQETLLGSRQILTVKKGLKGEISELKTDIVGIRTAIADSMRELKADIDEVKRDLSQVQCSQPSRPDGWALASYSPVRPGQGG